MLFSNTCGPMIAADGQHHAASNCYTDPPNSLKSTRRRGDHRSAEDGVLEMMSYPMPGDRDRGTPCR